MRLSLFQCWFSKKGKVPVSFSRPEDLDFTLLPLQKSGGKVLYDDGRVRVTPGFIQIGDGRMIVVSKIRELRRGLIWEPGLAGLIYRMLLISFFSGTMIFGLMQKWLYFTLCLGGWAWTFIEARLRPYVLSIHMVGSLGEYLEFSCRKTMDACGRAIEEAVQLQN